MESPQPDRIHAQLEKLLLHPDFSNKQRLIELLRFVVTNSLKGDVARLKESVIGVEVYRREPSYNPKENPIVRTEARRLRALLEQHYAGDGKEDELIISIPKGSYVAQFEWRKLQEDPAEGQNGASQTEKAVGVVRRRTWPTMGRRVPVTGGLLGACLIATAAYTLVNSRGSNTVWSARPFSRLHGVEGFASFSPDGNKVAFVWSGPKNDSPNLYWQDLKSNAPTQLTNGPEEENRPAWSPDGASIAFLRLHAAGKKDVMLLSLKTGEQSKIAELEGANPWLCIVPRLSWSNDGRYLFSSESFGPGEACGVVAIDLKTRAVRRITQPPAGVLADVEPAVSPNGKQVAFLRNAGSMGGDLYVVDITGGSPRRVTFDSRDIMGFSWSADGKSLVAASRRGDGVLRLWQMGEESKGPRQLTDGSLALAFPAASPRGNQIAYTAYRNITSIWQVNDSGSKQLTFEDAGDSNPQLSPGGARMVFRSDRSGAFEIWTSDRDGRNSKRVTHFNGPMVSNPVWSPDGRQIAFECRPQGHSDICLMAEDGGGETRRFTQWDSSEAMPSWARDGRAIYFSSNRSGRWEIYKQPVDGGGEAVQITHHGGMRAIESWDGAELYVHRGPPVGGILRLRLSKQGSFDDEAQEDNMLPGHLGAWGAWGAWDVGPDGPLFLIKKAADRQSIDAFDRVSGGCRTLFTLENRTPDGDGIFSVEPDGKSFLYVAEKTHEAQIGMLVPER